MYNKTKHKERKHFCMYCLQFFSADEILAKHKSNCIVINGEQAIRMPKEGSMVQFQNYHKQMPVPFVIYDDFEAITEKVSGCQPTSFPRFSPTCPTERERETLENAGHVSPRIWEITNKRFGGGAGKCEICLYRA